VTNVWSRGRETEPDTPTTDVPAAADD
jgi:hypothetical protein